MWQALRPRDFPNYAAGTWGPKDADDLLARNEREWRPQPATDQAASVVKLDLAAREGFIMRQSVVFLFDVDNTLLDNDRVAADLKRHLEKVVGHERQQRYWTVFEELRSELGYADYLGALQRYRAEYPRDPHLLTVSDFLVEYPFANRLFPNSLDALDHVKQFGRPVILSDGDVVFQPLKIRRSGLFDALDGNVLIYIHKEFELDDVLERFPADRYVLIDDKLRILAAVKKALDKRVTTVFVRQGHYAVDPKILASYPPADFAINRIGELINYDFEDLLTPTDPADGRSALT